MIHCIDLRRTLQDTLPAHRNSALTATRGTPPAPAPDPDTPPRDPDWALREIVDEMMFDAAR